MWTFTRPQLAMSLAALFLACATLLDTCVTVLWTVAYPTFVALNRTLLRGVAALLMACIFILMLRFLSLNRRMPLRPVMAVGSGLALALRAAAVVMQQFTGSVFNYVTYICASAELLLVAVLLLTVIVALRTMSPFDEGRKERRARFVAVFSFMMIRGIITALALFRDPGTERLLGFFWPLMHSSSIFQTPPMHWTR